MVAQADACQAAAADGREVVEHGESGEAPLKRPKSNPSRVKIESKEEAANRISSYILESDWNRKRYLPLRFRHRC